MYRRLSVITKPYWITGIVALGIAFISAWLNVSGLWQNAIPWGIAILVLSYFFSQNRNDSLRLGGVFGFVVSYSYLWFDNRGIHSLVQVLILIPLVLLPALFGLVCGAICGYIGWKIKQQRV